MSHIEEVQRLNVLEAKCTPKNWIKLADNQPVPMWGIRSDERWSDGKTEYYHPVTVLPTAIIGHEDADLICDLRNAAPWLLSVAGQFRAGDAKKLEVLTRYLFSRSEDIEGIPMAYILTAVHRMLAAARAMEAEQ